METPSTTHTLSLKLAFASDDIDGMRSGERRARFGAFALIGLAMGWLGPPAVASEDSKSGNSSQESSGENGSSDESAHSSGQSAESSGDSADSSRGTSDDSKSSENSPERSSRWASEGTTDNSSESSRSRGARTLSVAAAVLVGASVVGGILISKSRSDRNRLDAKDIAQFMRRNHTLLVQNIVMADGPLLRAWTRDLALSPDEHRRLVMSLDASSEQTALLQALRGPIEPSNAQKFSAEFVVALQRALGNPRTQAIVNGLSPRQ